MVSRLNAAGLVFVAAAAVGCGGGGSPPPSGNAGQPAQAATGADSANPDSAMAQSDVLRREVYSYRGAGRDPFQSLVTGGGSDIRPFFEDLHLNSILFDARYPARSIAVMRDTTMNQLYRLRVNDEVGQLRVTEIRRTEVVFTTDDFGADVTRVLTLRRRGRGNP